MNKPLAIFDLDYTLIDADCEMEWAHYLFDQGIVDEAFNRRIDQFDQDYFAGRLDYYDFNRTLLCPMSPFSLAEIDRLLQNFLALLKPRIRRWMLARVEEHRHEGCEVVLATASNSFLVEPIAALLGLEQIVCTPAEIIDGKPTGEILSQAAFREGKVARLQHWLEQRDWSLAGSWAYSDSHNDIPLLSAVDHPVAVTPDEMMRSHARQHGWSILLDPDDQDHFSEG